MIRLRIRTKEGTLEKRHFIIAAMLSFSAVSLFFLIEGRTGFSLWDEGYLWYGAQRVMAGEVPIRDFMSYDPGRYYWSAGLMAVGGSNGIMALRGSLAVLQALGLFAGLLVLAGDTKKRTVWGFWLLSAVILSVWMLPRHKMFDISLSIALVVGLSFLVRQPNSLRYFLAGLLVGLAAVFGRNHGVYGAVASLGIIACLEIRREQGIGFAKAVSIWFAGVVAGYLPCLLQMAVVPGFAQALGEDVRRMIEFRSTNLPLPVPWPWRIPVGRLGAVEAGRGVTQGLFFILIAAYGLLGIVWVVRQRLEKREVSPVLTASAFLAVPYAHFSYSRADVSHLAQGIFPFLLGSLALMATQPAKIRWPLAALLCGASLVVALPQHPGWQCYFDRQCVSVDVSGSRLLIDPETAGDVAMLRTLAARFASDNQSFIAAPFWPGAYALLGRKAPLWEIYPLWPAGDTLQLAEIERMKAANPGFAVVIDVPLDGREELRFRNTHPLIVQYIQNQFERVAGYSNNPACHVYRSTSQAI